MCGNYRLRIANRKKAVFYCVYNENINKIVVLDIIKNTATPYVEVNSATMLLDDKDVNCIKDAFFRAKIDCIELKDKLKGELYGN